MAQVVDLFGLPVTLGVVGVLQGRQCATSAHTTLWKALRLRVVQLPYQVVIQPGRMLSIVHL
jgi:hypothetical protein